MTLLFTFADVVFRAAMLIVLAIAPWATPLDFAPSNGLGPAGWRALVGIFVLLLADRGITRALSRRTSPRGLPELLIASLLLASIATRGALGPLAHALPLAAIVVWGTAIVWARDAATSLRDGRAGLAATIAVVAVGVATFVVAAARRSFSSRRVVEASLLASPAQQDVAIAFTRSLHERGADTRAIEILRACIYADATLCGCASEGARRALDAGRFDDALVFVQAGAASCIDAHIEGERAETLAGLGRFDEAARSATSAHGKDPAEPFACYAEARIAQTHGNTTLASDRAECAVRGGRGNLARVLHATLLIDLGNLDAAKVELLAALDADNADIAATYDLALVAQRQGRYHDAREGYLRALVLDPRLADARFNLFILTRDAGVTGEARHHLDQLAIDAPNDPRLPAARQTLATSPGK